MELKDVLAMNLRLLRQEREITQEELADRTGLSSRYVDSIERARPAIFLPPENLAAAPFRHHVTDRDSRTSVASSPRARPSIRHAHRRGGPDWCQHARAVVR
ncbi:helix-turn-helix transcriptional regulator [Stakelama sp. CBK3Z-3]|uniref:Helix-turn-helix transcriptional regulator n=1 Tax=Stakelama flava TaxID=2860338 RepID=A0ABS6XJK0_9SPHN|nr:helix-turn-helix transcriptional regulator [Stakelama flava]